MAFVVQTNPPTTGANGYISTSFFKTYHKDRGNSFSAGSSDIQKAIVRASDYLDTRFQFVGDRSQSSQSTEWPRIDAFDVEERLVNGIPEEVQEATAEYALISLTSTLSPSPTYDERGQGVTLVKEVVGPIEQEVRYNSSAFTLPKYPPADLKLIRRGLVIRGGVMRRAD